MMEFIAIDGSSLKRVSACLFKLKPELQRNTKKIGNLNVVSFVFLSERIAVF